MQPILPFWFKQRQCVAEPAGSENEQKLTGPNLGTTYIRIWSDDKQRWRAALRLTPDGDDLSSTEAELPSVRAAWEAAFELYRNYLII